MKLENKHPLLKKGYDILECVNCNTVCYPSAKRPNGTIVYNMHECKNEFEMFSTNRAFEINADGELVFDGQTI